MHLPACQAAQLTQQALMQTAVMVVQLV